MFRNVLVFKFIVHICVVLHIYSVHVCMRELGNGALILKRNSRTTAKRLTSKRQQIKLLNNAKTLVRLVKGKS